MARSFSESQQYYQYTIVHEPEDAKPAVLHWDPDELVPASDIGAVKKRALVDNAEMLKDYSLEEVRVLVRPFA